MARSPFIFRGLYSSSGAMALPKVPSLYMRRKWCSSSVCKSYQGWRFFWFIWRFFWRNGTLSFKASVWSLKTPKKELLLLQDCLTNFGSRFTGARTATHFGSEEWIKDTHNENNSWARIHWWVTKQEAKGEQVIHVSCLPSTLISTVSKWFRLMFL